MSVDPQQIAQSITQMGQDPGSLVPPQPSPLANLTPQQASDGMQQGPSYAQLQAQVTPPPLVGQPTSEQLAAQSEQDEAQAAMPPPPRPPKYPDATVSADEAAAAKADIAAQSTQFGNLSKAILDSIQSGERSEQELTAQELAALQAQPPDPPQPDANPLQRMAPLLILAALGGKATKLNANAMLGATTGIVQGYLAGDRQKFDDATKLYEQNYQQFKDRQAAIEKTYGLLRDSYKDQIDGDMRAFALAHQMHDDAINVDQNTLNMRQHWNDTVAALDKNYRDEQDRYYNARARLAMANKRSAAAQEQRTISDDSLRAQIQYEFKGGHPPTFGLSSTNADRKRYNELRGQMITEMGGPDKAIAAGIETKTKTTEAVATGKREAAVAQALTPLAESGGLFDQVEAAADKVNFTDSLLKDRARLIASKTFWANPDINSYVGLVAEVQTELSVAYARAGQQSDKSRALANDAFPVLMSNQTLKQQVQTMRRAISALNAGNTTVIDAFTAGRSFDDIGRMLDTNVTRRSASGRPIKLGSDGKYHYADQ